ncbi:MAG: 4-hydroxybenzoate octaprenyltransferase [Pseudomonadota bacterium]
MPNPTERPVADAVMGNWVDTRAPLWARGYLRLSRADRPAGTWLLYIPCLWAVVLAAMGDALRLWDVWVMVSCGIGAWLMRGAGCTWNDITDRHFDAQVERTKSRPLPSGQVTVRGAVIWMTIQAIIAFGILLSYGMPTIVVGVSSLVFVCIYPFAKRFTWWPQVFLGLAFNWGAFVGWVAHTGQLNITPFVLYTTGIAWTVFYDTIYAHQDIEDDALIGVKSTARLFGETTKFWLWGFGALATGSMALTVILAASHMAQTAIALMGVTGFAGHLTWQIKRLNIHDGAQLMQLFRSNRDAGLIPLPFFAIAAML